MNRTEAEAILHNTLDGIERSAKRLPEDADGLNRLAELVRQLEHLWGDLPKPLPPVEPAPWERRAMGVRD